jgi:hypothetical protein
MSEAWNYKNDLKDSMSYKNHLISGIKAGVKSLNFEVIETLSQYQSYEIKED